MPAVSPFRSFGEESGLMSYWIDERADQVIE